MLPFTHATLFRPRQTLGNLTLAVALFGFWIANTIAICIILNEAVSSFRECGLPYGLRDSLCTLQPFRSVRFDLLTAATLGTSGWLDLT